MRHVVLFFPLHPPVLEPDFDLALAQVENVCDLDPPTAREVAVEVELFFQLQRLVSGVRRPRTFTVSALFHCNEHNDTWA